MGGVEGEEASKVERSTELSAEAARTGSQSRSDETKRAKRTSPDLSVSNDEIVDPNLVRSNVAPQLAMHLPIRLPPQFPRFECSHRIRREQRYSSAVTSIARRDAVVCQSLDWPRVGFEREEHGEGEESCGRRRSGTGRNDDGREGGRFGESGRLDVGFLLVCGEEGVEGAVGEGCEVPDAEVLVGGPGDEEFEGGDHDERLDKVDVCEGR